MDKAFLNWLGGFYDGEGYAGCYSYRSHGCNHWQLGSHLGQKDKTPLVLVYEYFKYGSLYKHKDGLWVWCMCSTMAKSFLTAILPYLRSAHKRKQVEEALRKDNKFVTPMLHQRVKN